MKLETLSDGDLVDRWGDKRQAAKKVDADVEAMEKEFDRRGLKVASGRKWAVLKTVSSFMRLDTRKVKAEMGEAWTSAHEAPSSRTTYAFTSVT